MTTICTGGRGQRTSWCTKKPTSCLLVHQQAQVDNAKALAAMEERRAAKEGAGAGAGAGAAGKESGKKKGAAAAGGAGAAPAEGAGAGSKEAREPKVMRAYGQRAPKADPTAEHAPQVGARGCIQGAMRPCPHVAE